MIVSDEKLLSYLRHRVGENLIHSSPWLEQKRALEGNTKGLTFIETFGNSTINAYVGFIDLAGFSTKVQGQSGQEIANYLLPFLNRIIQALCDSKSVLIDKMIGDEIMFVLPDVEEEPNEGVALLTLGQILGQLHDLAYELAPKYCYRIGISYGEVLVVHLQNDCYSEWTVIGETVHVAKRLHQVDGLENPDPVCGAIGLAVRNEPVQQIKRRLQKILGIVAGFASRFDHVLKEKPEELKGVGQVLWGILQSKVISKRT